MYFAINVKENRRAFSLFYKDFWRNVSSYMRKNVPGFFSHISGCLSLFMTLNPSILDIFSFLNFACSSLSVVPADPTPCSSSPLPLPAPYSHHGSFSPAPCLQVSAPSRPFFTCLKKSKKIFSYQWLTMLFRIHRPCSTNRRLHL
jgi:hypothetical protein